MNSDAQNKELVKKKIWVLNKMKEREEKYGSKIRGYSEEEVESYGPWDLSNLDFELSIEEFDSFISELNELGILEGGQVDKYLSPIYIHGQQIYNKHGNPISNEIRYFYWNTNLKKLNNYLKPLLSSLTTKEIFEVNKPRPKRTHFGEVRKEGGGFTLYVGGLITYKDKELDLRTGLKTLCEIFMDRPNQLLDRNTLEDNMGIHTRDLKNTIAKYVSELNTGLEPHFGRKPIINYKKEGWIFKP